MAGEEKRIGSRLHGRYEILSIIQKGGMGTVFLGRHLELDKDVAIKLFHPHLTEKKEMVARFVNEARGVAKLHHRNIVSVFDIGADDEGIPFFVMEYLKGESLRERLKKVEALSVKASTDIMIQILSGLRVAHKKNIVHRDLKPGNIFLSREEDGSEVVKILDFGVAKFREMDPEKQGEITTDGSILGTPSYMSPEQATGKKNVVDPRSDLYSCGIMLYRCLTGLNVFKGDSPLETIQNIVSLEPPPPSFFNDTIPKEIDAVVLKAIQRDRDLRFQDCETFMEALKKFYSLAGTTPGELVAKIVSGEHGSEESGDHSAVSHIYIDVDHSAPGISHGSRTQARPFSRNKGLWAFLAVLLVVAAGLAAGWALFLKDRNETSGTDHPVGMAGDAGVEADVAAPEEEAGPPPEEKEMVEFEIVGLVNGASVLVNGEVVKNNPFKIEKSETAVTVAVTYEGEKVLEQLLAPNRNEMIYVDIPEKDLAAKDKGKSGKKKKQKEKTDEAEEKPEKKPKEKEDEEKTPTKIFKDFYE
jgi:serine/threonine-protein kinase